ncbi:MAG: HD domain-containing phosphohydrolase, partial [Mariprofundaceae bacterium]|nr:HD domain-containing phosphohydrolase [Mariprofundaceae bacterium]
TTLFRSNKKERLNKKELKEIHQAPKYGLDFLKQSNIKSDIILDACLLANERYDGSGATGLSGSNIAWSARLTGVLSMFEALIHYRPYRNRLLPRDAIREMVKHHKKAFDPDMLKALIESISLYPIGTYAQLNTGEIGLVTHIHPYRPLRPVVEIRMDRHGHAIPPRKIDLTTQPNLTVERCMYEEATLELANQQH